MLSFEDLKVSMEVDIRELTSIVNKRLVVTDFRDDWVGILVYAGVPDTKEIVLLINI